MDALLSRYLSDKTPLGTESTTWHNGSIRLKVAAFYADDEVPLEFVTSVRSIVLARNRVLLMRNPDDSHILPGGQREPGETLRETLEREVREEAGVRLASVSLEFLLHFHHESPEPEEYRYPYPDFLHLVYVSRLASIPRTRSTDSYETSASFVALDSPLLDSISPLQRNHLSLVRQSQT